MPDVRDAPTPRRGEDLPPDHPLATGAYALVDCVAEVPVVVLEDLASYYGDQEPPVTDVSGEVLA